MELAMFRRDEFHRLYDCSYNVSSMPMEERSHPLVGYALIAMTVVYEVR